MQKDKDKDSKYREVLQLSEEESLNMKYVKNSYCTKIRKNSRNKDMRVQLNIAYVYLARKIFGNPSKQQEQLIDIVISGNVDALKKKLSNKKSNVDFRTKGDNYPLIYHAVRSGHYDIVKLILQMGCNKKFAGDVSTPMHCAAYYGHYTIIPLLLQYGIPIDIKNSFKNLPIQEACTQDIIKLLKQAQKNGILQVSKKITQYGQNTGMINIQKKGKIMIKKIILQDYHRFFRKPKSIINKYVDAFHGTNYSNIASICLHGLHPAGSKVGDKELIPIEGHIRLQQNYREQENWAKAIFVSPSLFYSSLYLYAQQLIVNQVEVWIPLIQVKVKKGSFQEHKHTLKTYVPRKNEPQKVQFRVPQNDKNDFEPALEVISVMFLRKQLLQNNPDYNQVTGLALNSPQQNKFRSINEKE